MAGADALANKDITVVGGGIGGLTAALALARRGARVRVLEQADAIREVGAGIQISPNGYAVLRALGLAARFDAVTIAAQDMVLRDGPSGRRVFSMSLMRKNARYSFVHRADCVDLLATAAREAGVRICLGQQVVEVTPAAPQDGMTTLKLASGETLSTPLLVGADGLHSRVREALNGAAAPFFTGQVAWRALVPLTRQMAPRASVFMGAGRHLVSYPLRGGQVANVVAVLERREWAAEGWMHADAPDNLRAAFARFCPEVQALLAPVDTVYLWGLFRHPVAARWHQGGAALLGDAAHPTLPFMAQGANMALEDAWVLADCLDRHPQVDAALARYQARRRDRVVRVVAAANKNARNYHLRPSPIRLAAHGGLALASALSPALVARRFDWIYDHDVTRDTG